MFLDKRVYQGSSGKVYPNPFTDRISDTKIDKRYQRTRPITTISFIDRTSSNPRW